jgi:Tol biopolymer transport system component
VLWHNNFALDTVDGTQLASPSGGQPRTVDVDKVARPVPDGSRYAIYDYSNSSNTTTLTIKRSSDGTVLHQRNYNGYLRDLKPSPTTASQLLLRYSDSVGDPTLFLALDLATSTVLQTFDASFVAVDWLSDGRVVGVSSTGTLSAGLPGGTRSNTGTVDLQSRNLRHIAVQPGGTRLALGLLSLSGTGNVQGSDLWLVNLDGSNAVRYTTTNISNYGRWSPDGQRIAFDVDTGTVCTGSQCSGTCEIWHAPASASGLNPLPAAPGSAARFSVLNRQGTTRTLGCEVLGWTP